MAALWWFESCCSLARPPGWIHKVLQFCEWDSRARESHYVTKFWPQRKSLEPGKKNVQHPSLFGSQNILLPPLHIVLGLIKNFVKALDKTKSDFKYLYETFPRLSEAKIKEGVFAGPQIRELLRDDTFDHLLHGKEKKAWKAFQSVATEFLGNYKTDNYKQLVANLLKSYKALWLQYVTEDTLFAFPSRFPSTELWIKWLSQRTIPPGHCSYGEKISGTVGSIYACWLLLECGQGWPCCWV